MRLELFGFNNKVLLKKRLKFLWQRSGTILPVIGSKIGGNRGGSDALLLSKIDGRNLQELVRGIWILKNKYGIHSKFHFFYMGHLLNAIVYRNMLKE